MTYYLEDGSSININDNNLIGKGSNGLIYKDGDICFKKFFIKVPIDISDLSYVPSWNPDKLIKINNLKINNLCKIIAIIYDENNNRIGYLMPFYENKELDYLLLDKDNFIKIYVNLLSIINELSNNKITVSDLKKDNFVINDGLITFIDIDSYNITRFETYKRINSCNLNQLRLLLEDLLIDSLNKYHYDLYSEENIKLIKIFINDLVYKNEYDIENNLLEIVSKLDYFK